MTLYYVKTNLINGVTLPEDTVAYRETEDPVYTVDKLYNKRPSYPFRFTTNANQWLKIGFTIASKVTFLGLFNHNLTYGQTLNLKGGDTIGAINAAVVTPTWRKGNLYALFDATWKWWKLNVSDVVTPQIGELVLGNWAKFSTAYVQPGRSDGPVIHATRNTTHYGQDWTAYLSKGEEFSIAIKNINNPLVTDDIHTFLNDIWENNDGKFVFIPDHERPQVYYVQVINTNKYAKRLINGVKELREWKLELKTLTDGITLL